MSERITINCPACSATLAAPVSAVGRILLCPTCRTGIPVLEPNHVDALIGRAQQRVRLPTTNLEGAMSDLAQLQRLVPDHAVCSGC